MRYININTGAIIDSSSKIISKNWVAKEEVEEIAEVEETEVELEEIIEEAQQEVVVEDMNIEQIKELLEQMNIKYTSKMKRDELIELLEGD